MLKEKTEDILTRLKQGDEGALEELFHKHYPDVCSAIHRFVKDRSTVEDLAQEVFIRFWEKRNQLTINTSVKGYLRRMAINEGLGYLRKNKRFVQEELDSSKTSGGEEGSGEDQFLHAELERNIKTAINGLPPRCQKVFYLSRYEELTYKEIAEKMNISIKTVENQMGKALKILRKELKSYLGMFL